MGIAHGTESTREEDSMKHLTHLDIAKQLSETPTSIASTAKGRID